MKNSKVNFKRRIWQIVLPALLLFTVSCLPLPTTSQNEAVNTSGDGPVRPNAGRTQPAARPTVTRPEPQRASERPTVTRPQPAARPTVTRPEPPQPAARPTVTRPEPPQPAARPTVTRPEPPQPTARPTVTRPAQPRASEGSTVTRPVRPATTEATPQRYTVPKVEQTDKNASNRREIARPTTPQTSTKPKAHPKRQRPRR